MITDNPFTVLETSPPVFGADEVHDILARTFGKSGTLERLHSERDLNFLVTETSGDLFVCKIANSAESTSITRFQSAALQHIEFVAPELPVPRVIPNLDGDPVAIVTAGDERQHAVRLLSWLEGVPIDETEHSSGVAPKLGTLLAQIGQALRDFEHPASDYALLWDLKKAASLKNLLDHIDDTDLRILCEARLARFASAVFPTLSDLRWQTIHNDLNPGNILVDASSGEVTGVIDFGDMLRSPLIVDIAVACAYLPGNAGDPIADVSRFVEAYSAVETLVDAEIDILVDLILTRMTMTILIARWRAARYPENSDYILSSEPEARAMLAELHGAQHDVMTERLRKANARARRGGVDA